MLQLRLIPARSIRAAPCSGRRPRQCLLVFLCMSFIAGCGPGDQRQEPDTIVIEVTGEEFNWYFRYPGPDGVLGTDDDRHSVQDLYLPENSSVHLKLNSKDFLYSFALPELELIEIAVPGLDFELQFATRDEQTLQLLGDQFCGFSHETLIGKVYVRNPDDGFYDW